MPIVASRMLALLGAAQDYRAAAKRMHAIILSELASPATPQERLDNIALLAVPALLMRDPEGSAATLAAEATHWRPRRLAAVKRQAGWQRAKRGQEPGEARMPQALAGYRMEDNPGRAVSEALAQGLEDMIMARPDRALLFEEPGEAGPQGGHLSLETLGELNREVERALVGRKRGDK